MLTCYLHYCPKPCDECAFAAFLNRAFFREPLDRVAAPAVIVFREATFEHIYDPWETPRPIDNPETLRQECEKRGVYSEYLRDSLIWRSGARRWV